MTRIAADLGPNGRRIVVQFPYDPVRVRRAKMTPGASWSKKNEWWSYPLNLKTVRLLVENFGAELRPTPALRQWGIEATRKERAFQNMAHGEDADLQRASPKLAKYLRPYQRADAAFMALRNCANTNQPGLGKTVEVITAAIEAGVGGSTCKHLVIAPVTSLGLVWRPEILRHIPKARIFTGDTPAKRTQAVEDFAASDGGWLLINPAILNKCAGQLRRIELHTCTIDEAHKMGLSNAQSLGNKSAMGINAWHKWALTGTPIGGKPLRFWGIFRWLYPNDFGSQWQWADQWLEITNNGFGNEIGGIKYGREPEFYAAHAPYLLRRTKDECLPQLPPKIIKEVWCKMVPAQAKQYNKFRADAEIRIDGKKLVGTSILAEYQRLKQFAIAEYRDDGSGSLAPTAKSGKLDALLDRLQHHGIDTPIDEGGEYAIVGSQFAQVVDMVTDWLRAKGIDAAKLTGETKEAERTALVEQFQAGQGPRVIVMTTTAGGVSITLDIADSMHILDETWNPDDQEQLEDRIHRGSRNHQVTVYYYRSSGTIEEEIAETTGFKALTSSNILDFHRLRMKAKSRA